MNFSDILALLEILVTILFGYYITHWVTVRDTRTRSVKDLYLGQLSDIKKRCDTFFHDLFDGKLKGRTIADWYGHQQSALTCFDDGLRMALPIRKEKLEDIVNRIHETITGSEYYNDNFNKKKYMLTKDEQAKMLDLKNRVDKSFNEYVVQINNSRQYYFWETLKQNYWFDVEYFKVNEKRNPQWDALKIRGLKLLPYVFVFVAVVMVVRGAYKSYSDNLVEEKQRQEIFNAGIDKLIEKANELNSTLSTISEEISIENSNDTTLHRLLENDFLKYAEQSETFDVADMETISIERKAINKRRSRITTIHLDDNFDIQIKGGDDRILRGYDEDAGMFFYKLYFETED